MRAPPKVSTFATAAVVIGLALSGCGSSGDSKESTSPKASESSSAAETTSETTETSAAAPTNAQTVGDYLAAQGVTETLVKRGEPGAPTLDLPMPAGWADVGADTPKDAYGAIYLEGAQGSPPPAIIARMERLDGGTFDVAKILELIPNAVLKMPGWDGPPAGQPSELGGFEATAIAGTATIDGVPTFVARKGVVIPGSEHTYLLGLDAQGPADQQQVLLDAMAAIDEGTTITP